MRIAISILLTLAGLGIDIAKGQELQTISYPK
jgi:hypothetical protein